MFFARKHDAGRAGSARASTSSPRIYCSHIAYAQSSLTPATGGMCAAYHRWRQTQEQLDLISRSPSPSEYAILPAGVKNDRIHERRESLCQNRGNSFLWHNFVPQSAFCPKMAQRFQSGVRSVLWSSCSNERRPRRLCAKIEEISSYGTILCHNRRFGRKWHRDFNPGRGRRFGHQARAGAGLSSSVPKSRESLPVAQFCAITGDSA